MKGFLFSFDKRCFILSLVVLFALIGCKNKEDRYYLDNLKKFETLEYKASLRNEKEIKRLKAGIDKYKKIVDKKVKASEQLGIYYKMLAVRYLNSKMYTLALKNLKMALKYYPENPILFYLTAVCYARSAKAILDDEAKRKSMLNLAVKYYKRAISLNAKYRDALFGLAVLYVFELNKPQLAVPLLEKLLSTQKSDTEAMFLLARVYYQLGDDKKAVKVYDRIIKVTKSKRQREEALKNKEIIEVEMNGKK